ncbi:Os08g0535900 [Oryza sativa Japonica Group]|uniref:Os08g0535900 protein n=2 Tax=Oryza sativa subsp. japonica TaxID=39947 RepID=Q0J442_ORYSJ|nr:hypothetical protein EE612_045608 [Oryza sativa]BAD01225.1 unknown protein [Oryza sativa Japonica Group]BAD13110.1 unknown protein [Oryza sativa Japonica Group]BAF24273.1 Os08g0535900 [Oryza sativa Japonica Group]BAT06441.1 Os08g0535900 [Oryza sativa Japonica Group]|eukprot:NP_001062359.1 Os08g0535900 [Oryza sativa Japonica Group]
MATATGRARRRPASFASRRCQASSATGCRCCSSEISGTLPILQPQPSNPAEIVHTNQKKKYVSFIDLRTFQL